MDGEILWAVVGVAALAVLVVALVASRRARRRAHLEEWFGPEYGRVVQRHRTRRDAERDLSERIQRRDTIDLRPLPGAERERYRDEWRRVQESFVDRPRSAVDHADELVTSLLRERGYPVDRFGDREDMVSVDHPLVVDRYRRAHAIRVRGESGDVATEDLREAMVCYRSLFDEVMADAGGAPPPDRAEGASRG